ncbi:MAG: ACT domain-containing protein [Prolixibacteraceae bacterium]|nr:ACT domain-containing protein [Prolixibacteraceae bacterium]
MINLIVLPGEYTIYQLNDTRDIPLPIFDSEFYSVTKTDDEVSVLTNCPFRFDNLKSEKGWRGFKVDGIIDFSIVGIIHEITKPLKENGISVFVVSTFNTDYIFVKKESFQKAISLFKKTDSIFLKS